MVKLKGCGEYWTNDLSLINNGWRPPTFGGIMFKHRFEELFRHLHFNDDEKAAPRGTPEFDPLHKIAPLVEALCTSFKANYVLGSHVSVDEAMVSFKGRTHLRQYMPKKICKWGFKLWVLADSLSGYCGEFSVDAGRRPGEKPRKGLGPSVVRHFLKGCADNTTVYCDRFFSSVDLAKDLLEDQKFMVGTIQKARKGIPKGALFNKEDKKLPRGSVKAMTDKEAGLRVITWRDNEDVSLLATRYSIACTGIAKRKGKNKDGSK